MRNILYIVAAVLIITWIIGFFAFAFGAIIHILLVVALICFLVNIFSGKKKVH